MKLIFKLDDRNKYRRAIALGLGLLTVGVAGGPFTPKTAHGENITAKEAPNPPGETPEKYAKKTEPAAERTDDVATAAFADEGEPLAPPVIKDGNAQTNTQVAPVANAQLNAARQREENLRRLMSSLGCNVPEVQNAIIDYIVQDTGARQPLRDSTGRLFIAMRTPGLPDAQLSVYLKDCRIALEGDKTRRAAAETALRNAIGYQMTPRLEAMMLLLGLQGDMAFSAPNPKLIAQLEQKNKQMRRDLDGLKIEVESLRRERDAARTERDACRQGQPQTAPAPNPNAYDAPPINSKTTQDREALKRDIDRLLKENEALKRELEAARQANKR